MLQTLKNLWSVNNVATQWVYQERFSSITRSVFYVISEVVMVQLYARHHIKYNKCSQRGTLKINDIQNVQKVASVQRSGKNVTDLIYLYFKKCIK
jgi:hypothetical protein